MLPSSVDSTTPWTNSQQVLQQKRPNSESDFCNCWQTKMISKRHSPTGSEESVIMTSKASWFCFMNSKPSPTCKVSLGLKNPLAIPGRYFFDTLMTSYTADNINTEMSRPITDAACATNNNQYGSQERGATILISCCCSHLIDLTKNHRLHQRILHHLP